MRGDRIDEHARRLQLSPALGMLAPELKPGTRLHIKRSSATEWAIRSIHRLNPLKRTIGQDLVPDRSTTCPLVSEEFLPIPSLRRGDPLEFNLQHGLHFRKNHLAPGWLVAPSMREPAVYE
eukprot:4070234-Amphidinium_carterae.1